MTDIAALQIEVQKLIQSKQFKSALERISAAINGAEDRFSSELTELYYMKAVCERYLKAFDAAQDTLEHLHALAPEFGRAWQEEGHLYRDQGLYDAALRCYQEATRINPALHAAWAEQAKIFSRKSQAGYAHSAMQQYDRLKKLPRELFIVSNLLYEGKLLKAENLCRAFMLKNPKHTEGMRLLADIGSRLGAHEDADYLLESAVEFEPDNIQIRLDYIQALRKRQKFEDALAQAQYLYDLEPDNMIFKSRLAIEKLQTGQHEHAIALFDEVLEKVPNDPATLTSRAHALKTAGQQDAAIESYRAAFESRPQQGDAYYGLANLKTYKFTDGELDKMLAQINARNLAFMDKVHLYFSLGKAFEDRKDYARAFEFYESGNQLKAQQSKYTPDVMREEREAQIHHCTRALFEAKAGQGYSAPDPIFIVGLPRAGSTLLEQIIASHSQVDGTLELPNILSTAYQLRGREKISIEGRYPKILNDLSASELEELGQRFIEETRIHRQDAPFFIDKMPNNFRHIGLIHLMLPNAKIIDARRHPMACCFSGFKQLFAEGQEFTYGLENIGEYYKDYVALMDHWHEVLPSKILHVQYEDVVADVETQVRRILDYLALPFEDGCVEFHKTQRNVRTASSEQVRQPIFKSGLEQWRHFEPWLDPLKSALGPVLDRYPVVK